MEAEERLKGPMKGEDIYAVDLSWVVTGMGSFMLCPRTALGLPWNHDRGMSVTCGSGRVSWLGHSRSEKWSLKASRSWGVRANRWHDTVGKPDFSPFQHIPSMPFCAIHSYTGIQSCKHCEHSDVHFHRMAALFADLVSLNPMQLFSLIAALPARMEVEFSGLFKM